MKGIKISNHIIIKNRVNQFTWFFLCLMMLESLSIKAQQNNIYKPEKPLDSTKAKDSLAFYRKLEIIAKKRKLTREIFNSIFSLPQLKTNNRVVPAKSSKKKTPKKFNMDVGQKIIRRINILCLDPFGYDIKDTTQKPLSIFQKGGNTLHVHSKHFTIRNHLLFKKGQKIDLLKLSESERILRSSNYIRDARVGIDTAYKSNDSVDVFVLVHDRWSIIPDAGIKAGRYNMSLTDQNIAGTGQQLQGSLYKKKLLDTTRINYGFRYFVPYIRNTFITAGLVWNAEKGNEFKGISISRLFYSPLARWAGAVDIFRYDILSPLYVFDSATIGPGNTRITRLYPIRYWSQDYWLGVAFPLRGNTSYIDRSTKLVLAGRIINKQYFETIAKEKDPLLNYQNSTRYLFTLGISERTYYKDHYLFKYGVTEDVPMGKTASITVGYEKRINDERFYLGLRTSYGVKVPSKGYFSSYLEYGTYIGKRNFEQGVVNAGIGFFSNLIKIKSVWMLRQFAFVNVTYGLQRSEYQRINLNDVNGLKGFKADSVIGSNKLVLGTTTLLYTPLNIIGFRFAPILYVGVGMIGDETGSFLNDNAYPVIGLGLLIRNEYIVFNTFQLSIGIYPYIPKQGGVVKFNPLSANDFQMLDYQIGKPDEILYR